MAKFIFFRAHYPNSSDANTFNRRLKIFDIDSIEALIGDDKVVLSTEIHDYVFVTSNDGRTLKSELSELGASFLTNESHDPIPAAQLKYVFVEGVDDKNQHAWVNLAKVKGIDTLDRAVVGNKAYTLSVDFKNALQDTGAGVIIDIDV